jgi:hypothetical protein
MSNDPDEQIHRLADPAFAQTEPVAVPSRRRASSVRWLAVGAIVVVVLIIVGLLGLGGGSEEPEPADFSTDLSVLSSFAEVPLSELSGVAEATVRGVDFDEIAELTGIERAGFGEPDVEWTEMLVYGATDREKTPIVAAQLTDLMGQAFRYPEEFESELGWEGAEIAATVSWQNFRSTAFGIGFDVFRLDSELSPIMERAGADAIVDIGSGPDFEPNFDDTSTLRLSGVPLHIGVNPARSTVAVAQSTTAVRSWLDREGAKVADDPIANALASALDQTGDIYAFEASFADFSVERWFEDGIPDALGFTVDDVAITETFRALGVGWSGVEDTRQTSVVYVFDSAEAASVESIAQLYAPDARFIDADGTGVVPSVGSIIEVDTVTSSGTTVTVSGRAAPGAGPMDILPGLTRPSPFRLHR